MTERSVLLDQDHHRGRARELTLPSGVQSKGHRRRINLDVCLDVRTPLSGRLPFAGVNVLRRCPAGCRPGKPVSHIRKIAQPVAVWRGRCRLAKLNRGQAPFYVRPHRTLFSIRRIEIRRVKSLSTVDGLRTVPSVRSKRNMGEHIHTSGTSERSDRRESREYCVERMFRASHA